MNVKFTVPRRTLGFTALATVLSIFPAAILAQAPRELHHRTPWHKNAAVSAQGARTNAQPQVQAPLLGPINWTNIGPMPITADPNT